jgi:signal transduction histidine kinase
MSLDSASDTDDAELRKAMMATSRAILAKQVRIESALAAAQALLHDQNRELASTNAILAATLDATPVGVITCSLQGHVGRVNQRLHEMFPHESRIGPGLTLDAVAEVLHAHLDRLPDLREWHGSVLAQPEELHALQVTTPDGRHLRCRTVPQRVGTACVGVVLTWSDDTDQVNNARLRAETAAAKTISDAKSAFLSRASHELRTPLNAVCGFSHILSWNPLVKADPTVLRQVKLINTAGKHMVTLVEDLLMLSRMETSDLPLREELVDLVACTQEALALVALDAAQRQLRLSNSLPETAMVRGDPTRVRQVLLNLVSNGVKYNRQGGSLHVTVRKVDAGWATDVRDTGSGLSPDQLLHLYEPFNRLGAERLHIEGIGLGLAISMRLLVAMKGTLHVESEIGVGTCFTMTLLQ